MYRSLQDYSFSVNNNFDKFVDDLGQSSRFVIKCSYTCERNCTYMYRTDGNIGYSDQSETTFLPSLQ